MSNERRIQHRSRLLQRGRVVFSNGFSSVDVVVLDISEGGARIRLGGTIGLPRRFEVRLANGLRRLAEICYRSHEAMGVRFVDDVAA